MIRSLEFFEVDIWSFLSWFGVLFVQKKTRNWTCKKKNGDLKVGYVIASFLKDCHFLFYLLVQNDSQLDFCLCFKRLAKIRSTN